MKLKNDHLQIKTQKVSANWETYVILNISLNSLENYFLEKMEYICNLDVLMYKQAVCELQ